MLAKAVEDKPTENKIVAKFGGTSVKTENAIKSLAAIVKNNPNIVTIVVSAVGGVTNLLIDLCHSPKTNREQLINNIISIHQKLANKLNININEDLSNKILQRLTPINNLEIIEPKVIDSVVSLGEDLSSFIIHNFLNSINIKNNLVDARNFMITDNIFGKATPNLEKIKNYHFPQSLWITQGFVGSSDNKETTTLGRGGSDYSAALIAEAIQANELLIYTDVDGVYTMDPNIIPSAKAIGKISFQEMAEMANFGAKILHPSTLEPCLRKKIPVRILSTFKAEKPGTLIEVTSNTANEKPNIRAITLRKGQILVTIKSLKMLNAYGFLANIFSILAKYKISIDLITTSEVSVALTVDTTSSGSYNLNPFTHNEKLMQELQEFAEIKIEENLTLLAIIGSSLNNAGTVQSILSIVENDKIRMICYGASNSSLSILTPKDKAQDMAKQLHQFLIENL